MKNCLNRNLFLAFVFIIISSISFGQNYKSDVLKGDFAIKKGDFESAAKSYSAAIKTVNPVGKNNLDVLYKLGFCQMQIKNYSDATLNFAQYISISKNTSS